MTLLRNLIVPLIVAVAAGIGPAAGSAAVPGNTAPPTITGTPEKGMTLTAHNGTWTGGTTTYFYRWQRCASDGAGCANVPGASTKRYTVASADVDHTVRVRVTASNADGQAAALSKTSDLVSDKRAPKVTAHPTVSGTPRPGEELTASNGTWTGGATTFTYQCQRCDASGAGRVDVAGATGKTYGAGATDVGHTMRVAVTAKNLAGSTTVSSDVTAAVRSATPVPAPAPARAANHRPTVTILSVRWVGAPDLGPVPHLRRLGQEREHPRARLQVWRPLVHAELPHSRSTAELCGADPELGPRSAVPARPVHGHADCP
jgi:hypothetical protein